MASESRSRESRARAEEALIRFALLAGEHTRDFVVIGGLNPDFLAPNAPTLHQGTTDVDILLELGFDNPAARLDFGWVDDALTAGGFQNHSGNRWRWDAGSGITRVRLEFLCDVWDHLADTVSLPGSRLAAASKLAGPGPALVAPVARELAVAAGIRADFPNAPDSVTLRFANLGGYLLAKAAAALSRFATKDKYDLMYVILYNAAGGPAFAAAAVIEQLGLVGETASSRDIRATLERYLDSNGAWAGVFAEAMIDAGDESTETQLRTDAAVGAQAFLAGLED